MGKVKPSPGHPKKLKRKGTARNDIYCGKYIQEEFEAAVKAVKDGMSMREAEKRFHVLNTT